MVSKNKKTKPQSIYQIGCLFSSCSKNGVYNNNNKQAYIDFKQLVE